MAAPFRRRASMRSESISWRDALKKECYWQNELSYHNLKSQLKLVQNYDEWRSIYNAFRYKNITSDNIIKFLINQQGHFRKSYLHYLLISGYSRQSNISLFNVNIIPKDIQDIILWYINLIFIKLFTKSGNNQTPTLYTFDCNITVNNLIAILNKDNGYKDCSDLRLWTRYDFIKFMYSVQKSGHGQSYIASYHDKDSLEADKERTRWVQIPRDCGKDITLKEMDNKLAYHQVLEFGVDKLRIMYHDIGQGMSGIKGKAWTFKADEDKKEDEDEGEYNHFEWIQSLKIGDMVRVYINYQWVKGFIFGRDYDTFYIHIDNAKRFRVYADIEIKSIGFNNLQCLQRRYTRCEYDCKVLSPSNVNDGKLVSCEWMTAYNTCSIFSHYEILFE